MCIPLIMRKFEDGEVIAIFPTLPAGLQNLDTACKAFSLNQGQCHVDTSIMRSTTEPEPAEYVPLLMKMVPYLNELEVKYHDEIKVVKRIMQGFTDQRLAALKSLSRTVQPNTKKAA